MPEIKEKIKEDTISTDGKIVKNESNISENDIIIHTIPKRFLTASSSSSKAKSVGLVIILISGVGLIVGGIFTYIYLLNFKQPLAEDNQVGLSTEGTEITGETSEKTESDRTSNASNQSTANEAKEQPKEIASTTNIDQLTGATSTLNTTTSIDEATSQTATASLISQAVATTAPVNLITPVDSDADGLADSEEKLLGTDINKRDSDGDTFEDLVEVLKLYNPTGNGRIIISDYIKKYVNNRFGFFLYYPTVWQLSQVGGEDSLIFNTGDNQFVQVIIQVNQEKKTLNDWYLSNTGLSVISNEQILYKKGWEGIISQDGLTVYLTKPNFPNIIIMTYSLGVGNVLHYKNIFNMMITSLETNN